MTSPIPLPAPGSISLENWGIPLTNAVNALQTAVNYPILKRFRRTTTMSTTTTEVGVARMDDIPLLAGRIYRFMSSNMLLDSTVSGDEMFIRFRMNSAGLATTGSTQMPGANSNYREADQAVPEERQLNTIYIPSVDENLSVLLTCGRIAGTGGISVLISTTSPVDMYVEFLGTDMGSSGTSI
jgi:hypothetical protein